MTMNFDDIIGDLKRLHLTPETTAEYHGLSSLPPLDGLVLVVAVAGESNRPYWNEVLRAAGESRGPVTAERMSAMREKDRDLWIRHIVRGWRWSRAGEDVPYTTAACEQVVRALPDDWFDALRIWSQKENNYRPTLATKEAAKN